MMILLCSSFFKAQDCAQAAGEDNLGNFGDEGTMRLSGGNGAQVIVTSYQFCCCGDITAWEAYTEPNGRGHINGVYSINFQVWRPSHTMGSDGAGEYSLVGESRFSSIMFDRDGPISETPEPTNVISVRPGDVVGFFQSSTGRNSDEGLHLRSDFSDDQHLWYQTSFTQGTPSTLVAGNAGTLVSSTNAGPVLAVSISEFPLYSYATIAG